MTEFVDELLGKESEAKEVAPSYKAMGLVSMDTVEERPIEWLVEGWILKNEMNFLCGDGGTGKSTIACNIVSSLSNGKPCFFEDPSKFNPRATKKILYFTTEEDIDVQLARRFRKYGANGKNILTMPMSDEHFSEIKFDSEFLETLIHETRPDLVVFDPLQAFVSNETDMSRQNQMRQTMNHLKRLAVLYGTSFLILMHTNKRGNATNGRDKMSGSGDIYDIGRSFYLLGTGIDENGQKVRFMCCEKLQCKEKNRTIYYDLYDGIVHYCGSTNKTYDELVSMKKERVSLKAEDCQEAIIEFLKDNGKAEIQEVAKGIESEGFSKNMTYENIRRLKKSQTIIETKISLGKGKGRKNYIELQNSRAN